jgi:hypothetical protein
MREGFDAGGAGTHIIPLVVGDPALAVEICEKALARGAFAQAIRPPTVPPMTSRLRLAVMASHREGELRTAARILGQAARASGFEPRTHSGSGADVEYDVEELRPPAAAAVATETGPDLGLFDLEDEAGIVAVHGDEPPPPPGVFDFEDDSSVARAA